jgi:hypothetical protein
MQSGYPKAMRNKPLQAFGHFARQKAQLYKKHRQEGKKIAVALIFFKE